ncbi:PLDc N-terminal domain-containing protein [Polaribacter porphyrae]|uniref:Cardiolipin synthase N-terminal domain-containing protein n=1 Tax=Polaribacter porphyrae TaxID=1137780 RepID=A0A2S7WPW1_9FLAO|nr:hypothetical protein BTO18_10900 [Polaribacter porphyrae]
MKTLTLITLIVLTIILWFKAINDITKTKFENDRLNRIWFLIVFFIPIIGAIIYFQLKRKFILKKPRKKSRF